MLRQCGRCDAVVAAVLYLVVVEYRVEAGPVAVEEVFITKRIEIAISPTPVTKQRVRKPEQRLESGFEPQTADVDDNPVVTTGTFRHVVAGRHYIE